MSAPISARIVCAPRRWMPTTVQSKFNRRRERAQLLLDRVGELRDLRVEEVDVGEDRADPQPVVLIEMTGQGLAQRRDLLAHLPARELGQDVGIGFAGDQRIEHVAPGLAHHVRRDAVELDPGVLQGLVQPVDLTRALLDLRLAIAREIPQPANRLGRHEARLEQPGLGKPAQPGGVRDVGLAARDRLDVARVDQQALKLVLQDRPRRLPIDARRFHHDLPRAMRAQPVTQRQ